MPDYLSQRKIVAAVVTILLVSAFAKSLFPLVIASPSPASYAVSVNPARIQEGLNTEISLNVDEAEANTTYTFEINVSNPQPVPATYTANLMVTTNATGSGSNSTLYYPDFSVGANTNHVGMYSVTVMAGNETAATGNFTVGLTDKLEYRREETVSIRGSGYTANENVTVDVTVAGVSVAGYPKNVTSNTGGVVADSWAIPSYARPGMHTVTLTNTTDGTAKTPADAQDFTVEAAVCLIQTLNLADPPEPVGGVFVEAKNATTDTTLESKTTNTTGWVEFWLEPGSYTFEALYRVDKNFVPVGILRNQNIDVTTTKLNLTCQLSHIIIEVRSEAEEALPFIGVTLNYTYTARVNRTITQIEYLETNSTGSVASLNTIANISYEIEARRYGYLFNRTSIETLATPRRIGITCPTYTIFLNVLDSKRAPIPNVDVDIIEWSSEILVGRETSDNGGGITFSHTFGKYKIKVYNGSALAEDTVLLNETIIDLVEDQFSQQIRCKIYNIDLSLLVLDYFGQPLRNARIDVECDEVKFASPITRQDGTASLEGIIGGNVRFSVYVSGELSETRSLYLDGDRELVFQISRYIVVGGYPLVDVQFIALIAFIIITAIFVLALAHRRLPIIKIKKTEEGVSTSREA